MRRAPGPSTARAVYTAVPSGFGAGRPRRLPPGLGKLVSWQPDLIDQLADHLGAHRLLAAEPVGVVEGRQPFLGHMRGPWARVPNIGSGCPSRHRLRRQVRDAQQRLAAIHTLFDYITTRSPQMLRVCEQLAAIPMTRVAPAGTFLL